MPDDFARKQGARISVVSRARIADLPSLQSSYGSPFTSRFRCEYSTAFSRIYHIDGKHVYRGERNETNYQLSLFIPSPSLIADPEYRDHTDPLDPLSHFPFQSVVLPLIPIRTEQVQMCLHPLCSKSLDGLGDLYPVVLPLDRNPSRYSVRRHDY
jgi:hypothetical protein